MSTVNDKVIITAELTGPEISGSSDFSKVSSVMAESVYQCWQAGAAVVHLQMKNSRKKGRKVDQCLRDTIQRVRMHHDCNVIIDCTEPDTNCVSGFDHAGAKAADSEKSVVDGIEMGAYGAEFFNWVPGGKFENTAKLWHSMNQAYKERGIKPEVQIKDSGTLSIVNYRLYTEKNYFSPEEVYFQIRLGFDGGMAASVDNLMTLQKCIPKNAKWSVFGAKEAQFPMIYAALALGGNICVCASHQVIDGRISSSADVIEEQVVYIDRAVQAVDAFGKKKATSKEARELLGMKK